ncbi:MAG: MBL fold metallo-hydrolase [Nitrososphaeria archaeon]
MRITPLGEESLGIRSMCIKVDADGTEIILDPGASLAPRRYGLPPHPRELEALAEFRRRLEKELENAEYLFISHYHRDHYTPTYSSVYMGTRGENIYSGKVVLAKDFKSANYSQRVRGYMLHKSASSMAREWIFADGMTINAGKVKIRISDPIPHGREGSRTGYVIGISIKHKGYSMTYLPDVQGPLSKAAVKFATETKPDVIIVGGFPYYLLGYAFDEDDLKLSKELLQEIVKRTKPDQLIIAHHLLRSTNWKEALPEGISYTTYASLLGREDSLLEAKRKELYEREKPPPKHFELFRGKGKEEKGD